MLDIVSHYLNDLVIQWFRAPVYIVGGHWFNSSPCHFLFPRLPQTGFQHQVCCTNIMAPNTAQTLSIQTMFVWCIVCSARLFLWPIHSCSPIRWQDPSVTCQQMGIENTYSSYSFQNISLPSLSFGEIRWEKIVHKYVQSQHDQAPECNQQCHPGLLIAMFWVMSGAFVLAVGHSEFTYFTTPVLFSLVFLHTLYYMYLLKFLLHMYV